MYLLFTESRNKRIRYNLKVAVKKRDMDSLPKAVDDFKKAKLPDDDLDLEKAERILKEAMAKASKNRNFGSDLSTKTKKIAA